MCNNYAPCFNGINVIVIPSYIQLPCFKLNCHLNCTYLSNSYHKNVAAAINLSMVGGHVIYQTDFREKQTLAFTWDKLFKNGQSKSCGGKPLKNLLSPLLNTSSHIS